MLAPDWLHRSEQNIRSQVSKLTQLLTMTTTHKFPTQINNIPSQGAPRVGIAPGRLRCRPCSTSRRRQKSCWPPAADTYDLYSQSQELCQ